MCQKPGAKPKYIFLVLSQCTEMFLFDNMFSVALGELILGNGNCVELKKLLFPACKNSADSGYAVESPSSNTDASCFSFC